MLAEQKMFADTAAAPCLQERVITTLSLPLTTIAAHNIVATNERQALREVGIDGANWIWLAQDRVRWRAFVSTVMNLRVP
jgi:hypothetical protein